ncbi:hypothetical protein BHE74_00044224 [Ensete ventricosum]|nr:hypothetical protein GW17_00026079 [Ensete ventricosum]RWW49582.1 hypothetical protein BHE74_00044224 [Ensete ventricosum]
MSDGNISRHKRALKPFRPKKTIKPKAELGLGRPTIFARRPRSATCGRFFPLGTVAKRELSRRSCRSEAECRS